MEARLFEQNNLLERMSAPCREPGDPIPEVNKAKFTNAGTQTNSPVFSSGIRAAIAATTLIAGAKVAAETFDCSESRAKDLAAGFVQRPNEETVNLAAVDEKNAKLRSDIYDALSEIRDSAREKLHKVLGLIDDNTLQAIPDAQKAKTAAAMANQLAAVIDKTIEKSANLNDNRSAHLHLYAPKQEPVASYKMVRVGKTPEDNELIDVTPVHESNG